MKKRIRLCNFLIDSMIFFIVVLLASVTLKSYLNKQNLKVIMIVLYYLYYFIFELTIGQTIGKMITKTKVVAVNQNKKVSFVNIFIRTFSRLIPIDILSYLFSASGVHDFLSKTELKKINY